MIFPTNDSAAVVVGEGAHRYRVVADWPTLPEGWNFIEVPAVAVDGHGRVHLFQRGEHPVLVFDASGVLLRFWGDGQFRRPHGMTIAPDGMVWCVDDFDHTAKKFSPQGELLLTLGTSGQPSDTGATSTDYRTIVRAGRPFNFPTNVAVGSQGEIYVADGYGNACVHKFSPAGEWLLSWGAPGGGPGEFRVPHGVAVDKDGLVWVCDRENSRLQRFTGEGVFVDEWTGLVRPCQVFLDPDGTIYVAELGLRAGRWSGTGEPKPDDPGGRVSIFDSDRNLLARWGGGENPTAPGDFFAPHDIHVDAEGSVYVSEVDWSAGGRLGMVPAGCHSIQKFERQDP